MNAKNLLMAAAATAVSVCASTVEAAHKKVLMIGNSFSICVLKEMPQCAADAGETLDLASLYIGGCQLDRHWSNIEKATDPNFRPYLFSFKYASAKSAEDAPVHKLGERANIPQALSADRWDVVTIQQASHQSMSFATYVPYADNIIAKIRELAPQAEIVMQETWSYTPYSKRLAEWGMTSDSMHDAVKDAYSKLAKRHNLRMIPTGDAVWLYRKRLPVNYGKLLSSDEISNLKPPMTIDFCGDVVGGSHWGKVKDSAGKETLALRTDFFHLNADGHYLQACTWLAALFGTDVTKLTYAPKRLAPERAKLMRQCAADAVAALKR